MPVVDRACRAHTNIAYGNAIRLWNIRLYTIRMWDIYTTCTNRHTVIGYICLGHFMPGRCRWSTEPVGLTQPRMVSGVTQGDLSISQGDALGYICLGHFMPGRCRWSTEPVGLTQPRTVSGVSQGDLSVSQGDATGIYMFRAFHAGAVPVVD